MIRHNPINPVPNAKSNPSPSRVFTRILRALKPQIDIFWEDYQQHLARGIITTQTGIGYTIELSFDDDAQHLRFLAVLPAADCSVLPRVHCLFHMQIACGKLGNVCFDPEQCELNVQSCNILPDGKSVDFIVPAMVQDFQSMLEDERLASLLN